MRGVQQAVEGVHGRGGGGSGRGAARTGPGMYRVFSFINSPELLFFDLHILRRGWE